MLEVADKSQERRGRHHRTRFEFRVELDREEERVILDLDNLHPLPQQTKETDLVISSSSSQADIDATLLTT